MTHGLSGKNGGKALGRRGGDHQKEDRVLMTISREKKQNDGQKEKRMSPDGTLSSFLRAHASATPTYKKEKAYTHTKALTQSPAASVQAESARHMQNLYRFSVP